MTIVFGSKKKTEWREEIKLEGRVCLLGKQKWHGSKSSPETYKAFEHRLFFMYRTLPDILRNIPLTQRRNFQNNTEMAVPRVKKVMISQKNTKIQGKVSF